MSVKLKAIKSIESLSVEALIETLKQNGFTEVLTQIQQQKIDGKEFLNLTEADVRAWTIGPVKKMLFRSFLLRIKEHPDELIINSNFLEQNNALQNKKTETTQTFISTQRKEDIIKKSSPDTPENITKVPNKKELICDQPIMPTIFKQRFPAPPPQKNENKTQKAQVISDDENGYLTPNQLFDLEEETGDYEPAPYFKENNKISNMSYRELKTEWTKTIMQTRYSTKDMKERPLPPLPDEFKGCDNPTPNHNCEDEEMDNYSEIDENRSISESNTQVSNLHMLLQNEIKKRSERDNLRNKTTTPRTEIKLPVPPKLMMQLPAQTETKTLLSKCKGSSNESLQKSKTIVVEEEKQKTNNGQVHQKTLKDLMIEIQGNPYFHNVQHRKEAKFLLKEMEDGAFLIRPAFKSYFLCVMVVKRRHQFFNIGIAQGEDLTLKIDSVGEMRLFNSLSEIIDHFSKEPLMIIDEKNNDKIEVILKKIHD